LLCIRVAKGNGLAVADVSAKHVEIAVKESAFSLVDHVQRFRLVCFQGGHRFREHGLGFVGRAVICLLRESRC
jgi:hypothetical protein